MFDYISSTNDWILLQSFLQKKNDNRDTIKELSLIEKQTNLLKDLIVIMSQAPRQLRKNQQENLLPMQSLLEVPDIFKNKNETTLKKKPSHIQNNSFFLPSVLNNFYEQDIDEQQLLKALVQIKEKCSFETYNIAQKVTNRNTDANLEQLKKTIYRQYSQMKELKQKCLVLNCDNQLLRQQLEKVNEELENIKNQKIQIKKKKTQYFEKEDQLVKLYTKLSLQQKKINDSKKINSMRENLLENVQNMMQSFIQRLNEEDYEAIKQLDLFKFCDKYRQKMDSILQQIQNVRNVINQNAKKCSEQTKYVLMR